MSDSSSYGEFGAAFFGALAAFALEAFRRWREEHKRQLAAGNETIFVLAQMYSVIRNSYDQGFVARAAFVKQRMGREATYLEYQPLDIAWNRSMAVPVSRLGFLLESHDPDILNRISLVERAFLSMMETNLHRNTVHIKFQELSRPHITRDGPIYGDELEESVGMDIVLQLKQLTESLQLGLPVARDNLLSVANQLTKVLGAEFPIARVLSFTPSEMPIAGVGPPAGTRKAAPWRTLVRAIVNWLRGRAHS
jgi:hypothetical protein